ANGAFTVVTGPIRTHYADWALAYNGPLGWPTGEAICTSGTECVQPFEFGTIVQSGAGTAVEIDAISAVVAAHAAALGDLTQTPRAYLANGGGFVQGHRNGAIAWTQVAGAHMISGAISAE